MHPEEWVLVEYWWLWVTLAFMAFYAWAGYMICAAGTGGNFWKKMSPPGRLAITCSTLIMIACVIVAFKALYHRLLL